jgi:hypothetical protein
MVTGENSFAFGTEYKLLPQLPQLPNFSNDNKYSPALTRGVGGQSVASEKEIGIATPNVSTSFLYASWLDMASVYHLPYISSSSFDLGVFLSKFMANFFEFEADFVDSLRCIPMQVRMKLDTCGVKLKLTHWHQFTQPERQALVEMPCFTAEEIQAYGQYVQQLVIKYTGAPASELPVDIYPAWMDATTIPPSIQEKAQEFGVSITSQHWTELTPAQRFALIKLSRPSHENKNFFPALKEFHLI